MVEFKLTKEQLLAKELFRSFAENEIKPISRDMDEAEKFDMDLLDKMKKYGLMGIPYSKEYGGEGADVLTYALAMEEVSKVDASAGITISVHTSLCCSCINDYASEEQKQKFLRPLVDGSKIGCFGLTEPGAGTDASGVKTSNGYSSDTGQGEEDFTGSIHITDDVTISATREYYNPSDTGSAAIGSGEKGNFTGTITIASRCYCCLKRFFACLISISRFVCSIVSRFSICQENDNFLCIFSTTAIYCGGSFC